MVRFLRYQKLSRILQAEQEVTSAYCERKEPRRSIPHRTGRIRECHSHSCDLEPTRKGWRSATVPENLCLHFICAGKLLYLSTASDIAAIIWEVNLIWAEVHYIPDTRPGRVSAKLPEMLTLPREGLSPLQHTPEVYSKCCLHSLTYSTFRVLSPYTVLVRYTPFGPKTFIGHGRRHPHRIRVLHNPEPRTDDQYGIELWWVKNLIYFTENWSVSSIVKF